MRRLLLSFTLVALSVLLAAACGDDSEPAATPANDLDGAALYGANCASCHGADLRGTSQGPSHLSIVYEPNHHGDEAFRSAIRNGAAQHHWDFGDMPPVEGLTDDEVDAIIAFVRAEQEEQGFEQ
ncbi:MAG: c-type cytochrome [Acidimicrobiales bacterium]|nr:c-type cytochrome [Acidimicrobiales bacterium]